MKNRLMFFCLVMGLALFGGVSAQELQRPRAERDNPRLPQEKPPLARLPEDFVLTPEMEKEALDYLAQTNPHEAEGLGRFKLANPQRYTMRIKAILDEKAMLASLQKNDPARYEREIKIRDLERQTRELSESYRKAADEAARKPIRTNLNNAVTQLFDLREMNRQDEVKRMEFDLQRLKETLVQRQKNRASIIERRIQQLTGEASAMEWE